jgi:hypothetical protein
MNRIHNVLLILPLLASLLIAGCGGGGAISVAEGGIGGTGISTGTVTGIGSITVNGVKFNTDNAAIYIEGVRVDDQCIAGGNETCLRDVLGFNEGQVVRVVGSFNDDGKTGTAEAVYYNDSVEGPVESVTPVDAATQQDATVLRLVVMRQVVIIDSQTLLEGTTFANIGNFGHDLIEVTGLRDPNGQIRAGYVRNTAFSDPDDSPQFEIKGVIASIDPANSSFTIDSGGQTQDDLVVNYSGLAFSPVVNMQVEVKGDNYNAGELIATSIELEDDISGRDDDDVEYEGIVTTAPAVVGGDFVMGVQPVQVSTNTIYKGGLVDDVTLGVRLEVEGYLQGGILIADEVRFRDAIKIEAPVASHIANPAVTPEAITITLNLGLDTFDVLVNELSKLGDDAEGLSLAELDNLLSNDDYVKVRGRLVNAGLVFAEELKVKVIDGSSDTDVKLQGPIEDDPVTDPVVTILGITINVDTDQINVYEGPNDNLIDRDIFFNTVLTGNIVSAEGKIIGGVIDWDKLEIEDEE